MFMMTDIRQIIEGLEILEPYHQKGGMITAFADTIQVFIAAPLTQEDCAAMHALGWRQEAVEWSEVKWADNTWLWGP
jgi:hypothetical protein